MDITQIIIAIIALLTSILTVVVVPLLKNKLTTDKQAALAATVTTLVQAAEQLYKGAGRGEEKLSYVTAALYERGIVVDCDDVGDAVRAMIEAAVLQLKK